MRWRIRRSGAFTMRMTLHAWAALVAAGSATSIALAPAARAAPVEPVYALARKEKPAVIETLRQLVSIESGSRDKAGLDRLAALLAERLTSLGGRVEVIEPPGADVVHMHDTPKDVAKVVLAHFEGKGRRRIMLLAHMDTVYPHGTLEKQPFRVEGQRAYGPGVADEKSGIAVILHTLAMLRALDFHDYAVLTVLVNGDEEVSTPGARNLIGRVAAEHDLVFSCEPTQAPQDFIETATSGIAAATLTVRGRAAHAGVAPEQGRNALVELANQILQTRDLADPERGVKFNWTMANAGTTRNVIPDLATAVADVRVKRTADYDTVERAFRERTAKKLVPDAQVEAGFERRRPPLEPSDRARATAAKAPGHLRRAGQEARAAGERLGRGHRRRVRGSLRQARRPGALRPGGVRLPLVAGRVRRPRLDRAASLPARSARDGGLARELNAARGQGRAAPRPGGMLFTAPQEQRTTTPASSPSLMPSHTTW
jgi:glutamate carboxypeptidase